MGTTTIGLSKKDLIKNNFTISSTNNDKVNVKTLTDKFSRKEFEISSKKPVEFRLNTFNFP